MKNKILYQSTNRDLKTSEIRGYDKQVSFAEALFMGLAPDEGLFMPTTIPRISRKEIIALKGKPYKDVAFIILKKFLSKDVSDASLKKLTAEAYNFDIPLEKIEEKKYLVRLDRGPTASFKDFAARAMARMMYLLKQKGKSVTVLVATSGDTGSAVGEAYKGLSGIKVHILYPALEVTPVQKKQLDSIGGNVKALSVSGKFDDCQNLVKEAFLDEDLRLLNLTSANSINIGRLLAQVPYYFYSYVNVAKNFEPVIFSVPSGNFGNSLGCELARRMGLPVKKIIVATNENDEFPKFLETGIYKKVSPSRVCLSNAMNVGNPSNLARYFYLYGGILDREGVVHKQPDIQEMKKHIYSTSVSDKETVATIKQFYKKYGKLIEPHGAVGLAAMERYFENNNATLSISLETADPAKFSEIIKKELNIVPDVPRSLKKITGRKGEPDHLTTDYSELKKYLLEEK